MNTRPTLLRVIPFIILFLSLIFFAPDGTASQINKAVLRSVLFRPLEMPFISAGHPSISELRVVDRNNMWVLANEANLLVTNLADPMRYRASILYSSDGGYSWKQQWKEDGYYVTEMQFIDSHHGWVVGDNGVGGNGLILMTRNGGKNWVKQNSQSQVSFWDVNFINVNCGWVLGAKGEVFRTLNGGATWSGNQIKVESDTFSLSFSNQLNGLITGDDGEIYLTNDGGKIWINQWEVFSRNYKTIEKKNVYFRTVKLLANGIAYIVMNNSGSAGDGIPLATIFKTEDGGKTWSKIFSSDKWEMSSIQFIDGNNAWAIPSGRLNDFLLFTKNGGKTWKKIAIPTPADNLSFIDNMTGWFVNSDHYIQDKIYSTKDGGATWGELKVTERIVKD